MSKIYQPPGQPFDPLYIDCLENCLMREFLNFSTQSLTPVIVKDIPLVANLFDTPGKKLTIDCEGIFTSGGGNAIQLTSQFDGGALANLNLTAGTLDTIAPFPSIELWIKLYRRNTDLAIIYDVILRPVQVTNSIAQVLTRNTVIANVNFAIAHTFTILADVNNAADVLTFGALNARVA